MVNVRGRAEVSSPIFLPAESRKRSVLQLLASSQPPGLSFPPTPHGERVYFRSTCPMNHGALPGTAVLSP